jgi:hypothetical protein
MQPMQMSAWPKLRVVEMQGQEIVGLKVIDRSIDQGRRDKGKGRKKE